MKPRDTDPEIEVHVECNGEVVSMGPDGISYCTECECICEGETEYITESELEARLNSK